MTTVYSNSIEIEWKPGGASDIINYRVKYRLYKSSLESDQTLSNDYNEQAASNEINEYSNNDYVLNQSNDYYDSNEDIDENYSIMITNSTRFRIGNSSAPLKPYTFYEFKVVAANALGLSKETNTLVVRTAATSKYMI